MGAPGAAPPRARLAPNNQPASPPLNRAGVPGAAGHQAGAAGGGDWGFQAGGGARGCAHPVGIHTKGPSTRLLRALPAAACWLRRVLRVRPQTHVARWRSGRAAPAAVAAASHAFMGLASLARLLPPVLCVPTRCLLPALPPLPLPPAAHDAMESSSRSRCRPACCPRGTTCRRACWRRYKSTGSASAAGAAAGPGAVAGAAACCTLAVSRCRCPSLRCLLVWAASQHLWRPTAAALPPLPHSPAAAACIGRAASMGGPSGRWSS